MQPGDTISPLGGQPDPPVEMPELPVPLSPSPPQPELEPEQPEVPAAPPTPIENRELNADFLSWTASEFIEHQKPQGWYATLAFGAVLVSAAVYFLVHDVVTVVVIAVAAVLFGITGARKPRPISYALSHSGLQVGDKAFSYAIFKSFSVIEEGAIDSIQLHPLKPFMPPVSLYFPPDQEEQIVGLLSDYLPHEDKGHDSVDRLMKRMHF